jgi:hypothetical protein
MVTGSNRDEVKRMGESEKGEEVRRSGHERQQTVALASQDFLVGAYGCYDDSRCASNVGCPMFHGDAECPMVGTLESFIS